MPKETKMTRKQQLKNLADNNRKQIPKQPADIKYYFAENLRHFDSLASIKYGKENSFTENGLKLIQQRGEWILVPVRNSFFLNIIINLHVNFFLNRFLSVDSVKKKLLA